MFRTITGPFAPGVAKSLRPAAADGLKEQLTEAYAGQVFAVGDRQLKDTGLR